MGVTIKPQSQIQSTLLLNQAPPFLLCFKCQKSIPSITMINKSCFIWIELNCKICKYKATMNIENFYFQLSQLESKPHSCSLTSSHSENGSNSYCYQCKKWLCQLCLDAHKLNNFTKLHYIIAKEINLNGQCMIHKDEIVKAFCQQCNMSICNLCKSHSHNDHSSLTFDEVRIEVTNLLNSFFIFEEKRKQNQTIKNELIHFIDKEIEDLNKIKEVINSAYERNENSNKMIHNLLLSIKNIYQQFNDVQYLDLMANIVNNFNQDNEELRNITNDKALKSNCLNAINFWNSHYIIKFKNDINCISTIEASNDKTLCMIQLNDQELVTGTSNGTIKVWSMEQRHCVYTLQGHQDKVFSLCQISDNRLLSGSVKEIKCWGIPNWNCLVTLNEHANTVFSIIPLRGNKFASGSADKIVKIWDGASYKCISNFNDHECSVYCLNELRDGRIASGSRDKTIRIWNVQSMKSNKFCLQGHNDNVNCLLQLSDGKLASGSSDNTIKIWNIEKGVLIKTLSGSRYVIFSLLQLNDGSLLSGTFKEIIIWYTDLNGMKQFTGHNGAIRGLVKLKDQQIERIASFSDDQTIKLWTI